MYLEDIIEIIGGLRDTNGNENKLVSLLSTHKYPINLARYDVNILNSLSQQTFIKNLAYTDRQADLARTIVTKYARQLNLIIPNLPSAEDIPLRMPIRNIDRRYIANIVDDIIEFKFPYDKKLIEVIKNEMSGAFGGIEYDPEKKCWKFGLTEYHVNFLGALSDQYSIILSDDLKHIYDSIVSMSLEKFAIELVKTSDGYTITNAANELLDYIQENCGGFGADNLISLVDNSAILGYSVSQEVLEEISYLPENIVSLMVNNKLTSSKISIDEVVKYATITNRLPVHVYHSGVQSKESSETVEYLNGKSNPNLVPKILVSPTGFMIGKKRSGWLNNAEKVLITTDGNG